MLQAGRLQAGVPLRKGRARPAAMTSMLSPMPAKLRLISCLQGGGKQG